MCHLGLQRFPLNGVQILLEVVKTPNKPFLSKTALLARARLLLFGVVVHLSATAVHGTQQEVGLGRQSVGGRLANHSEGTTSTSHGMATCVESGWSHQVCQPAVSQSIAQERQGQGSTTGRKPREESCDAQERKHSHNFPQPRRTVEDCTGQGCQARGSIDGDWRRRSGSCGSAGGVVEGSVASPGPSSARSRHPYRGFLELVEEEVGDFECRTSRIQEEYDQVSARIRDAERRLVTTETIAQPSPFTMQPDPQEEIRLLRAPIAQMEKQGSMEDGTQEGSQKRPKMCATSSVILVPLTSAHNRSQSGSTMSDLIDQANAVLRNR